MVLYTSPFLENVSNHPTFYNSDTLLGSRRTKQKAIAKDICLLGTFHLVPNY